jgi:hypothetical protein
MGVEGGTGVCRPLHTLGTTSGGDPLNRSLWRLHHRSSFLRRFIGSHSLRRRSRGSILLRVLVVAVKETKGRDLT